MLSSQIGVEKSHENEKRAQRSDSFAVYESTEWTQCGENPLSLLAARRSDKALLYTRREIDSDWDCWGDFLLWKDSAISWNLAVGRSRARLSRGLNVPREFDRWHMNSPARNWKDMRGSQWRSLDYISVHVCQLSKTFVALLFIYECRWKRLDVIFRSASKRFEEKIFLFKAQTEHLDCYTSAPVWDISYMSEYRALCIWLL